MLRIVAETFYQLWFYVDDAVESLKNATNLFEEIKKEVTDPKALISEIEENIKDTEVSLGYGLYLVGALITFIPGSEEGIGEGVF